MNDADEIFEKGFEDVVAIGNRLAEEQDEDLWDVADGLLAGAIQFWLYSRQPCGDPRCADCAPIATAAGRLQALLDDAKRYAEDSEYFHQPTDVNIGRA